MRYGVNTTVERDFEYEGQNVARGAYICDSRERQLIINNEQLGTIKIDPAVESGVTRHQVARELSPRPQGLNRLTQSQLPRRIAKKDILTDETRFRHNVQSDISQFIFDSLLVVKGH